MLDYSCIQSFGVRWDWTGMWVVDCHGGLVIGRRLGTGDGRWALDRRRVGSLRR